MDGQRSGISWYESNVVPRKWTAGTRANLIRPRPPKNRTPFMMKHLVDCIRITFEFAKKMRVRCTATELWNPHTKKATQKKLEGTKSDTFTRYALIHLKKYWHKQIFSAITHAYGTRHAFKPESREIWRYRFLLVMKTTFFGQKIMKLRFRL